MRDVVNDERSRPFCGPTVLAGITEQPISIVKTAIRRARYGDKYDGMDRRPPVKGTHYYELRRALTLLGWELFRVLPHREKPTLARWFKTRSDEERQWHVIVEVTNHWTLVKGNRFLDTFSKGKVTRIGKAPGRRKRVHRTYLVRKSRKVTKAEIDQLESSLVKFAKRQAKADLSDRSKIVKLGGKPKVYSECGLKYCTITFDPPVNGIREIETLHYNWSETLERVELGLDDPTNENWQTDEPGRMYVGL